MTDQTMFSNDELTAYLDGEADADLTRRLDAALREDEELRARLDALDFPKAALAQAFDAQLSAAPPMPTLPPMAQPDPAGPRRGWGMFGAGAGGGLVAGIALAIGLGLGTPEPSPPGWLDVVVDYQALYVPETLAGTPSTPDAVATQLAALSNTVNLDLTGFAAVEGLRIHRAQELGFRGKPLVQLAYALPDGTPVAICILQSGKPESAPISREIKGMAAVHWTTGSHGILIIGGTDQQRLDTIAPQVAARI